MIKELISKALISNGAESFEGLDLTPDKKKKALDLAKESVLSGLTNSMTSGNIGEITKAFSGAGSSSLIQNVISTYSTSLITKLGLSESVAKTISKTLIPMIFSYIGKSKEAPTDNDEGIKGMLGDLVSGGLKDKLGGMMKKLF